MVFQKCSIDTLKIKQINLKWVIHPAPVIQMSFVPMIVFIFLYYSFIYNIQKYFKGWQRKCAYWRFDGTILTQQVLRNNQTALISY